APPPVPAPEKVSPPAASVPPAPPAAKPPAPREADGEVVPAGPATRHLARELGVDLTQVRGTGRAGRGTQEDVKGVGRQLATGPAPAAPVAGGVQAPALPRFEDFGPVERQPLSGLRKIIARNLSLAWNLIPHVTQHDLADITDLESFRKEQSTADVKLT